MSTRIRTSMKTRKTLLAMAITSAAAVGMSNSLRAAHHQLDRRQQPYRPELELWPNWLASDNVTQIAPANSLATDIARFGLTDYTGLQPVVDAARSVNGIVVDGDTSGGTALNITGSQLNIGSGGITLAATNVGNVTISNLMQLGANSTFTNASGSDLLLEGGTPGGGINNNSYNPRFLNVNVTGAGNIAVGSAWGATTGNMTALAAWGTFGTGANTQYLALGAANTSNASDLNLTGYTGGTSVDSGSGGDVAALTSTASNYEVPNLTVSATIADATAAKAHTMRSTPAQVTRLPSEPARLCRSPASSTPAPAP